MPGPELVALVHDRLEQNGGAERVLWALHGIFPDAPIFTPIWNRRAVPRFASCDVRTSWMQRLPGVQQAPRAYAALYPLAFAGMRLTGFDLVISTSSSFAQGIRTDRGSLHVCYCHSPANFIWRPEAYFRSSAARALTLPLRGWLKAWDRRAAQQPDVYVTTGRPVAARIRSFYGREAAIVAPPIERRWFARHQGEEFFLVVSRLVPHKRVDLAIEACSRLGLRLVVAGDGRAAARLRHLAGPEVEFRGYVPDDQLRDLYARAIAVLQPSEEEFGLVALEAQAAGTPIVAYDAGGARETVIDGVTGLRFARQTEDSLMEAIRRLQGMTWDRDRIQENASRFEEGAFQRAFMAFIEGRLQERTYRGRLLARQVDAI